MFSGQRAAGSVADAVTAERSEGAEAREAEIKVFTTRPDTVFGATFMVLAPEHPLVDAFTTPDQQGRGGGLPPLGGLQGPGLPQGGRAGEDRRLHRRLRHQSRHRQADPGLDRRLRADGVRHRRHHGGAGPRRARLRVRAEVRPADRPRRRPSRCGVIPSRDRRAERGAPTETPLEAAYTDNEQRQSWSTPASSTASRSPTPSAPSPPGWPSGARARPWSTTGCTTGASPASATGARRSRSSTATSTARCRCRRRICRSLLPLIDDFQPDDSGISPLARHEEWYYVPCPVCGKQSRRETDVSDTFLDSSWYYLRYPSTEFDDRPFDPERTKKWLPVTTYIGGNEHAVLHLLYSRFITMVLHELGHAPLRRAVPEVPGPRPHREGRGQDVQVPGQRRRPRRVHRPLGRRHLPDVPHVPGPVPGGRRLPGRGRQRPAAVPGQGLGPGGRHDRGDRHRTTAATDSATRCRSSGTRPSRR